MNWGKVNERKRKKNDDKEWTELEKRKMKLKSWGDGGINDT
jgi:hypothetical protein